MFSSLVCVKFSISNNITLCISYNGDVYSVGYSKYKSHGHNEHHISIPTQINNLTNIKMIDCGCKHTICLENNGNIFSFGSNEVGQLGIGIQSEELQFIPQKIELPPCRQISCGEFSTICLTEDNILYSFGDNRFGQLGLENYEQYSPQLIPDLNDIEFIICGGNHSICKTYNNEYYSWGSNKFGQLGQGKRNKRKKSYYKPIHSKNWPDNIISIKCGSEHSLLLTSEGQVYSFGNNEHGELGINNKKKSSVNIPTLIKDIPEIQRIECGYNHSMCIDLNNNLWLFGYNYNGQLGLGDNIRRFKPILHPTLSNIIDISSKGCHTFVKTIDNKIYAFGNNNFKQLGIKSKDNQYTPIQVFKDNEEIWCSTIGKSKQKSARK